MRIGIDLGGTKIEAIAMDGPTKCCGAACRRRATTTRPRSPRRAISSPPSRWSWETSAPSASAFPARSRRDRAGQERELDLADRPASGSRSRARLGRPVRLTNDANCFALSEATDGAAQGRALSSASFLAPDRRRIVVNGRVLEGRHRIAGEWGHNPLPWPQDDELPGPACYCGRTGCIETFLSGPDCRPHTVRSPGAAPTAAESRGSRKPATGANEALTSTKPLARALASIINVLDPDVIVLGGGVSNIGRLYARVPALLKPFVFSDRLIHQLWPPAMATPAAYAARRGCGRS